MNSAVKDGKVQLNKTNYFNNLKNKAKAKDDKEQIAFNKEVLNCIDIICNRMEAIESQIAGVAAMHNTGMEAVGNYLNEVIRPILTEMQENLKEIHETLNLQDADGQEGDETMDA